ncbi:hypothetical protein JRC04_04670 [Mycolicibacterium sp. S2-37]|uniref:hypothetical protein n=1 Tax=Mycolicibacterium sp. S2-37 TaxID=2810297 RepID=UPI001A93FCBF|nr:hypothetical protein [Mycolicibacterium sp. S2-37]MBO0676752.1 hypothetical protein [Mycolicibacterium sp. S2-37]
MKPDEIVALLRDCLPSMQLTDREVSEAIAEAFASPFLNVVGESAGTQTIKGENMIEAGRVVTKPWMPSDGWGGSRSRQEEGVKVYVGVNGVGLSPYPGHDKALLTADQAVELGQLLMKAAESHDEYAAKRKALEEESTQLDNEFKERISGLGVGGVKEPGEPVSASEAIRRGDLVIVEAG